MTKKEKQLKIKNDLAQARTNFINDRKGRTHPNELKVMIDKRFGK